MLLAQHLSHLLLQGADALLCLAHLAGRFLTQLLELLPNCIRCSLATSAFRRLISLAYAATRCESRRLYSAILRMVVCCSCSSALSRAFSSGYEVSITPLYSRLYAYSRAFRPLGMLPVNAFQQHGQLRRRQVDFAVTGHRPDEAATFQPLVNMHRPSRSAHSTFIMSPRRPRKMNRCPLNGSSCNVFCTLEARPLKPLRMSVMPATSQMREPAGSDITANSPAFPG